MVNFVWSGRYFPRIGNFICWTGAIIYICTHVRACVRAMDKYKLQFQLQLNIMYISTTVSNVSKFLRKSNINFSVYSCQERTCFGQEPPHLDKKRRARGHVNGEFVKLAYLLSRKYLIWVVATTNYYLICLANRLNK